MTPFKSPSKIQAHYPAGGINREVLALHGDRAPPVSILDSGKTYKAKFQRDFKPSHWASVPFKNSARSDGLELRHWRKQKVPKTPVTNGEANGENIENEQPQSAPTPQDYNFAKYNPDITVPTYTEEQYEEYLRSDDWSREETDYLIGLVKEYYYKWPIIIDRYDYKSKDEPVPTIEEDTFMAIARVSDHRGRTLEQVKARFYEVWAKCIEISAGGEKNMSESEFIQHELLIKYDPTKEKTRKDLAWQLASRSIEEVREEEFLLSELQRIMISAQRFEAERAEVRARLEIVKPSNAAQNSYQYNSLNTLNQLYAQLMAQDRNRKARHRLSLNPADMIHSPAGMNGAPGSALGQRDSLGGSAQKRGSLAVQTPIRQLSQRQELRFGITTHDRLTSGVTFRSDKLLKMRQAKSQIQTQKIAAALTELEIPEIIVLPTDKVMTAFEALIQKVTKLVEARKVLEKEEGELRVAVSITAEKARQGAEAAKQDAEGDVSMASAVSAADEGKGDDEESDAEAEANENGDQDGDAEADEDEGNEDEDDADGDADADGEVDEEEMRAEAQELAEDEKEHLRPSSSRSNAVSITRAGHKRSASVLSAASSRASSKRSRRR